MILGDAGDVNILPSIVVEVADGNTHVVAVAHQSGFLGDVRERTVMVVVEKAVVVFRGLFLKGRNRCPVNEKDIQVPVVVVIDETNARDHRLRLVFVRSWTTVRQEVQTRSAGDVFKTNPAALLCLCCNHDRYRKSDDGRYRENHGKEESNHWELSLAWRLSNLLLSLRSVGQRF